MVCESLQVRWGMFRSDATLQESYSNLFPLTNFVNQVWRQDWCTRSRRGDATTLLSIAPWHDANGFVLRHVGVRTRLHLAEQLGYKQNKSISRAIACYSVCRRSAVVFGDCSNDGNLGCAEMTNTPSSPPHGITVQEYLANNFLTGSVSAANSAHANTVLVAFIAQQSKRHDVEFQLRQEKLQFKKAKAEMEGRISISEARSCR
ncbi:hypothetical protein P3T76_006167 [Phytophthora citrophthora]|uniref:Uncharacterized protein n=1 Tax=Phytophthora citrophthora TaxID=4793 RepID=A0AAD9LMI8_9STRA|nr:hypothetical protein P3T76_006167 [Phytophthora citrophthora]